MTIPRKATWGNPGPRPTPNDPWDGLILVDKPPEWTSHDVVAKLRNRYRLKKVGHGGTLDPMATGLLVILTGRGTKLSNRVMAGDKTYEGTMHLGVTTDSYDADGEMVETKDPSEVTREDVEQAMKQWAGDVMQTPPMVSAIKKDGVPLYKLARKGKTVERKPRLIHIFEFRLLDFKPPEATFRLVCTKGTYARSLCHDVGQALGCGAHLTALRRTASGTFHIDQALSLDQLVAMEPEEALKHVVPIHRLPTEVRAGS